MTTASRNIIECPALLIAAPASGQGKTTATAALARWYRNQGRRVRVFKTGPDFLDPMVLEHASGQPVHQLDLWMGGETHCRELLHSAACEADLILVEGVMGLHDGTPSSADLALRFGLPVLAVIDGSAMAQTFGAIAHGLATYRPGLHFAGVLANRVGSASHAQMLRESLPAGMTWFGALPRDEAYAMPSRHLGLVQAEELADLDQRIERAALALGAIDPPLPELVRFEARTPFAPTNTPFAPTNTPFASTNTPFASTNTPFALRYRSAHPTGEEASFDTSGLVGPQPERDRVSFANLLSGIRIAIARDAAFSFLYRANLDTLRGMGAELAFFSPLADERVPESQALYLPGGYPELHLERLGSAVTARESIRAHHASGKPIVAECGGMLALLESLTDAQGNTAPMLALVPGHAVMQKRLVNLGLHSVDLPEGCVRGHTFHYAHVETSLTPVAMTQAQRHHGKSEGVYRAGPEGRLHASFLHMYFPSNPQAVARFFRPNEGTA